MYPLDHLGDRPDYQQQKSLQGRVPRSFVHYNRLSDARRSLAMDGFVNASRQFTIGNWCEVWRDPDSETVAFIRKVPFSHHVFIQLGC